MNQIEKVARAIWDQQRNHWGHYRDMVPDLCEWEELTQSKQRELMREAKAAIAAMQRAPQWQGIESAPRDGKAVLLWVPADDGWDAYVASGWYESGAFDRRWYAAVDENPLSPQPTHWMPLPTPPAGGSDAE